MSSTKLVDVNVSSYPSRSESISAALARVVDHAASVAISLSEGAGDDSHTYAGKGSHTGDCNGTHLKLYHVECAPGKPQGKYMKSHDDINTVSPPSSSEFFNQKTSDKWFPFFAWLGGLILIMFITAVLVCRCLRSNYSMRDSYIEIPEARVASTSDTTTVAVSKLSPTLCSDGNPSRRRFLESRRAAAAAASAAAQQEQEMEQRTYGTAGSAT